VLFVAYNVSDSTCQLMWALLRLSLSAGLCDT